MIGTKTTSTTTVNVSPSMTKQLPAAMIIDVERIHELPEFHESVKAVCKRVTELKFVPFFTFDTYQGLHFAVEGTAPQLMTRGAVWADPDSKLEDMARSILYMAGMDDFHKILQARFEPYCRKTPDECESIAINRLSVAVNKALLSECLEKSSAKWVAHGLLIQSKKAIEDGIIREHNRKVHSEKLAHPLRLALWDGMTVEQITKLAEHVKANSPNKRPSLEEAWAQLGVTLGKKPKGGS